MQHHRRYQSIVKLDCVQAAGAVAAARGCSAFRENTPSAHRSQRRDKSTPDTSP